MKAAVVTAINNPMKVCDMSIDLSVLILAYNKGRELRLSLRAFELQKDDVKRWELVIVDDGSTDDTARVIRQYAKTLPIRLLRIKHTGNRNLNRNYGINRCRGTRIVYIDGDIIPTRHLLKNHRAFGARPVVALGSRLGMARPFTEEEREYLLQGENIFILETVPCFDDMREMFLWVDKNMINTPGRWMLMHSHNFSMPLALLKEIGGFEERLIYWGADDLELGYRFMKRGLPFIYDRSLGGIHQYHPASVSPECEANVAEFYNIHRDEAVEFLYQASFMNYPELVTALRHCTRKELTVKVKDAGRLEALNLLPGNTILNCLEAPSGPDGPYPRMRKLGIHSKTLEVEGYHDNVILSPKLMHLGPAAFLIILTNMHPVARRIYIYDPKKTLADSLRNISRCNAKKEFIWKNDCWLYRYNDDTAKINIHISAQTFDDRWLRNYSLRLLGVNAGKHPDVSHVLFKTEMQKKNVSDRFLKIDVKEEISSYFLHDDLTFVFLEPWEIEQWKHRYQDTVTVFWNGLPEATDAAFVELENKYDLLLFDNERDHQRYRKSGRTGKPSLLVEPFVNARIFRPRGLKRRNKTFTITMVRKAKDMAARDDLFLKAVTEEFGQREDVRVEVYYGRESRLDYYSPYLNESLNALLAGRTNANALLNEGMVDDLLRPFRNKKHYDRIRLVEKDLSEEELAGILERADVSICLDAPCLAAMSVACGTPIVTQEHNRKYAFLDDGATAGDLVAFVPTRLTSDYLSSRSVMSRSDVLELDLAASREVDWSELKRVLRKKYNEWKKGRPVKRDGRRLTAWLRDHSADRASERIVEFFSSYRKERARR